MSKKIIRTPADFETTRLLGENFDRLIIPSDIFLKIIRGEYFDKIEWSEFRGENAFGKECIMFRDNFIVPNRVDIKTGRHNYPICINGGKFIVGIFFTDCSFGESVEINFGEFTQFEILKANFYDQFTIGGGRYLSTIIIDGAEFNEEFYIKGGKFLSDIKILNGVWKSSFRIVDGDFYEDVVIFDGYFDGLFEISRGYFFKRFEIDGGNFYSNVRLSGRYGSLFIYGKPLFTEIINIGNIVVFEEMRFKSVTLGEIFLSDIYGDNLIGKITFFPNENSQITIRGANINFIDVQNINIGSQAIINLENIVTNKISISGVYNYGVLNLNNVKIKNNNYYLTVDLETKMSVFLPEISLGQFKIVNSDLGKTHFIDCDFSKVYEFEFRSSKITEIYIVGSFFPDKITTLEEQDSIPVEEYSVKKDMVKRYFYLNNDKFLPIEKYYFSVRPFDYEQHRLGYGQLKKVFENRGDIIASKKYYSLEMNVLYHNNNWFMDFNEKLLLWLNKVSNNYSSNWLRGILFTLVVTHVFFGAYAASMGYYIQFSSSGYQNYYKIFKFFSIVSDFELLSGYPNIWSYIWCLVGRIFIAFGIYQTIAAFRKHGRSGA